MRAFPMLLAISLTAASTPGVAHAWADAQVSTAHASVRMEANGDTAVRMDLRVHVIAGWLTELEVAGLDRSLTLDDAVVATFARETGEPIPFELDSDASGRVVFRFQRADAPRAGEYAATFGYRASIADSGVAPGQEGRTRYSWVFPAWAAGLDSVGVDLHAPPSATVDAMTDESGSGVALQTSTDADGVTFAFHRVHLPRSIPWPVAFSLPNASVPPALRPDVPRPSHAATVVTSRDGRPQPTMRFVVLAFVVVALAKRWTFARAARARGCTPTPLVPIDGNVVASVLVLALGAIVANFWARYPELAFGGLGAIVALVAQRPARRTAPSRLGSFRVASAGDLRAGRWDELVEALSPLAWFDATRCVGFLVAALTVAGLATLHARESADSVDAMFAVPHALGLLALLFVVGNGRMLPRTTSGRLMQLADVARTLRVPADHGREFGFRLVVHRDVNEIAQDARLRLVSEHRAPGLVRLDIAIVERATLGGHVATPVVLVVVRQGSDAERILSRMLPVQSVRVAPGGRRARILPIRPATFATLERLVEPAVVTHVPLAARRYASPDGEPIHVS